MSTTKTILTCKVGKSGSEVHAIEMEGKYTAVSFPLCGQPRRLARPHSFGFKGVATVETVTCSKCLTRMS